MDYKLRDGQTLNLPSFFNFFGFLPPKKWLHYTYWHISCFIPPPSTFFFPSSLLLLDFTNPMQGILFGMEQNGS